jgi:hypothetical protein
MKHLMLAAAVACAFATAAPLRAAAETTETAKTEKDEYIKKARAELDELDGRIAALELKAESAGVSARGDMDRTLKDLKARRKTANKSLAKLKRAGGKAWSDLEVGVDKSLQDLKKAIDKAVKE